MITIICRHKGMYRFQYRMCHGRQIGRHIGG